VTRSLSLVKKRLAEDAAYLSLDIAERKIIKEHYDRLRMGGSLILIGPYCCRYRIGFILASELNSETAVLLASVRNETLIYPTPA
jgi:hypothetical protein